MTNNTDDNQKVKHYPIKDDQTKVSPEDVKDLEFQKAKSDTTSKKNITQKGSSSNGKPTGGPPGRQAPEMIPFSYFFRFLNPSDRVLIILGTIAAIISGALIPSMAIILGNITSTFNPSNSVSEIKSSMNRLAGIISLVGLGMWISGYIYFAFWQHLAENISFNLRSRYLHAILKQEVSYFELQNVEQLPSQIGENFAIIQDSIGEKFSNIIFTTACMVSGVGIAFYSGADYAAICFAYIPIIFVVLMMFAGNVKNATIAKIVAVKKMGGIVEESLSAIRLITSFAQEERELKKFSKITNEVRQISQNSEKSLASFIAIFRFAIFGFYCFTLWVASVYVKKQFENPNKDHPYNITEILSVIVSLMTAMTMIFGLNPNVQAMIKAKVVGKFVFDVIDRVPEIIDTPNSVLDFNLSKSIKFEGVTFKYPTAPDKVKNVLEGASFQIRAGETTAIVGPSGSGKSTIVQMIERFYDPLAGQIFVDDNNLKDIKLKTLRESIGYVSQEPVLILGTIRDNLMFGNKDATQEDMDYAIKLANAGFVYDLESKLDTYCGSSAVLNLSGGQKQRIAIARALIKRPKILILDEATSALDPKSEKEVQGAIDRISKDETAKLTIIMIAHRLQTIMTAQNLLYLEAKNSIIPAVKGTKEYDEIIYRLEETNYAHQKDDADKNQSATKKKASLIQMESDHEEEDPKKQIKLTDPKVNDDSLEEEEGPQIGMMKIMSYYNPKCLAVVAYFVSILNAFIFPLNGLIFSKVIFILQNPNSSSYYSDRNFWCGMFIVLCFGVLIVGFFNKFIYSYLGENLTYTVRNMLYGGIIFKQLGWFDNKKRAPGILSNILSEDITHLNGLSSEVVANLFEAFLCLVIGIVLCFIFTWKMALVTMGTVPFVILGGVIMARLQWKVKKMGGNLREKGVADPYEEANALLSDMLINYRTVISFGEKNIDFVMKRFDQLLEVPNKIGIINAHKSGFWFGYSQGIRMFFMAFVFYIASIFIFDYGDNSQDTFTGVYLLFVAALGSGVSISQAPSISKAKNAATTVFGIIDEDSKIDTRSKDGEMVIKSGFIELKNVDFKYPSREQKVLNKMNMKIQATKKIALVGHSGCGKSTIANLLLRMYDIMDGQLLIDGIDIRKYNVKQLRRQIGIVMQEPLLFNMSIKDNILYGNEDASDQRVREVAEMANALAFIESNIEDLNKEEVQEKLENEFREFVNSTDIVNAYPNFKQLLHKYFDQKLFDITELQLILEVLQKGDKQLRNLINLDMERFCSVLKANINRKGFKWDDLVLRFEWTFEADKIVKLINETSAFKQTHKNAIQQAILNQTAKFDIESIKEYQKQIEFMERSEESEQILRTIINNSFDRIKSLNNLRIKSLHQQNTHDKNFKLHEGFNKNCGLKGSMLSGGQKQRVAIARALIKDPKILILDEATSALDEQSQELVQQALDRAMEGRTSVVIAHRLSTIRNCELLFVIHNGVVVEQGTYDELSADTNSYFYKLKSGMEM